MSRRLNLHLPTSTETILHRPSSENPDRASSKRSPSSSSFSSMQEKLAKTSQILSNFGLSSPKAPSNNEDQTKELQALKAKVSQLEKEKITAMVNRNYIDQKNQSIQAGLKASILNLHQSISNKVKNKPEFELAWARKFPSDKQFDEKIKKEEYAGLLLKAFEFVDEVMQDRKVVKTCSLKSSMSIRREKISNIYQQITDCMKGNSAGSSLIGSRRVSNDEGNNLNV